MVSPATVVLLDFDGTAYRGDLPIQAYARRVAERLDPAVAADLIGLTRAFLERQPLPLDQAAAAPAAFWQAEDGYELVRGAAEAAGVPDAVRRQAYLASREDLATAAWALDPEPGLAEFLAAVRPAGEVWLATMAPTTGIAQVLDAVGLAEAVDRILARTMKPVQLTELAAEAVRCAGSAARVLAIGDRWAADLEPVHQLGGRTAHLDRFDRGLGTPTWRAHELAPLLPTLERWAADPEGTR